MQQHAVKAQAELEDKAKSVETFKRSAVTRVKDALNRCVDESLVASDAHRSVTDLGKDLSAVGREMREQTASIRPTLDALKMELALVRSDLGAAQQRQNELHAVRTDESGSGGGVMLLRDLHAQIEKRVSRRCSSKLTGTEDGVIAHLRGSLETTTGQLAEARETASLLQSQLVEPLAALSTAQSEQCTSARGRDLADSGRRDLAGRGQDVARGAFASDQRRGAAVARVRHRAKRVRNVRREPH